MVGYADDLVVLVVDRDQEALAKKASVAVRRVMRWMDGAGLELATQKTDAILLTGRKRKNPIRFRAGEAWIETGGCVKYLGVLFQGNLTFTRHVERVTAKTKRISAALARVTPNVGGAGYSARLCFYRVAEAVLLYASPNWDKALKFELPRRKLRAAQRKAIFSLVRAYRTVSWDALCVLAGMPPIELVAAERKKAFQRKWSIEAAEPGRVAGETVSRRYELRRTRRGQVVDEEMSEEEIDQPSKAETQSKREIEKNARREDRTATLGHWQEYWNATRSGTRTKSIIPRIDEWIEWGPRAVTFRLAQYVTGHGCYAEYLHRMGKIDSPKC